MSLGNDLASIRKKSGASIEEVHSSVKIPIHILVSIEDDSIFESTEHNTAYIRSFIRSYARALKINDSDIVSALDSVEAGIYENDLVTSTDQRKVDEKEERDTVKKETPFSLSEVSPPSIETAPIQEKPSVESVNWADVGKGFAKNESRPKNWFLFIGLFLVVVLLALGFYFRSEIAGLFSSSDSASIEVPTNTEFPTAPSASAIISDSSDSEINTPASDSDSEIESTPITPPLARRTLTTSSDSDTLSIVVYAAFDVLDPVRVTSDFNGRTNPFWMESGEAYVFDFNDTLLVRGQYSRMLLLYNGHVVENPVQNYFNDEFDSIMLTRSILSNEVYFTPPPSEFPYEVGAPDSLVYKISY